MSISATNPEQKPQATEFPTEKTTTPIEVVKCVLEALLLNGVLFGTQVGAISLGIPLAAGFMVGLAIDVPILLALHSSLRPKCPFGK